MTWAHIALALQCFGKFLKSLFKLAKLLGVIVEYLHLAKFADVVVFEIVSWTWLRPFLAGRVPFLVVSPD